MNLHCSYVLLVAQKRGIASPHTIRVLALLICSACGTEAWHCGHTHFLCTFALLMHISIIVLICMASICPACVCGLCPGNESKVIK